MQVAKRGINRMPLIGRAWKANVNVRKRHLILQLVFNRGECMMHVDKNADGHVLDVDRISREIAYVPLNGRIRSKRSSCMQPPFFFFFWKKNWVQDMLTRGPMVWSLDVLLRGPMDLKFGRSSHRFDGLKFGRASQRSDGFGCASQRSDGLKFGRAS